MMEARSEDGKEAHPAIPPVEMEMEQDEATVATTEPPVEQQAVAAGTERSPSFSLSEYTFFGMNRSGVKFFSVATSLVALIVLSVITAPSSCAQESRGCREGFGLLLLTCFGLSLCGCIGLCETASVLESKPPITCCGCKRKEHEHLIVYGFGLGVVFFFLSVAASWSWELAMAYFMVFFCVLGCVGLGGVNSTRPEDSRFIGNTQVEVTESPLQMV
mmetsp:Transcript_48777/g.110694  ORF Transcript_48777/g.110694 Transcript_48777/m.110694 type:complete len:217 (-) Transcript_48777:32-682(-)|eukprot:CAMPEP_0172626304 /NCGR_PEP_ID=MMETSP1068-20121228/149489_1 /TAXON_ID=35684 /ORGANISM="Pseudopedinella elastica, Strain CCMP716" /LENGTH=216 /DNA_ID=CAMNT_0013435889 /DNA_START=153 /DNA_END=803 /DNA_ORIENTATION=-